MGRGRKVLICPLCGGTELNFEAGLITGQKYHCKSCDYVGALALEQDLDAMEAEVQALEERIATREEREGADGPDVADDTDGERSPKRDPDAS